MNTWIIISWVAVAILTGINIFVFLKLKKASTQMMKMAFPQAKNMGDALSQMQAMMGSLQKGRGGNPFAGGNPQMNQQMKMAMDMLNRMQRK